VRRASEPIDYDHEHRFTEHEHGRDPTDCELNQPNHAIHVSERTCPIGELFRFP
jgi:hypothetical protein